ncbi:MAG: hypothetical protein IPQ02_00670 [Saprospiraceae bacterium]|nr:hypothetical protein [Candidatus Defluviibacterium haderslevense]
MRQDLFLYLYPMPDDVAQSMLISETESHIHIRPLNANAKKIWLHNKLIRNLITSRKTLILVDSAEDVTLIKELLDQFNINHLSLFFKHSRSEIEKHLIEFSPKTIAGKLDIDPTHEILDQIAIQYHHLAKIYENIYHKTNPSHENYIEQLCRWIKLNTTQINFRLFSNELISHHQYLRLKKGIESATSIHQGNLPLNHPLNHLNDKLFELFLPEEAWTYITHFIDTWIKTGEAILSHLELFLDEWTLSTLSHIQDHLLPLYDTLVQIKINQKVKYDAALKIKYDYTLTKFKNKILEFIPQQHQLADLSWMQTIEELNLSQIQQIIYQHTLSLQLNINPSQLLSQTHKRSFELILSEVNDWLKDINNISILLQPIALKSTTIHEYIKDIKFTISNAKEILNSKTYFEVYFNWKQHYQSFNEIEKNILDQLRQTPYSSWGLQLDLFYYNQGISSSFIHDSIYLNDHTNRIKEHIKKFKNHLPTYIQSLYEQKQFEAIQALIQSNPNLYESVKNNRVNSSSLQEYYHSLPTLATLFPIIILEHQHQEYFPQLNHVGWDEVWNLSHKEDELYEQKLEKSSYHYITINEGLSAKAHFNIAISQAPPIKLKNLLTELHPSEMNKHIFALSSFILSNVNHIRIWINSNQLCLSFLPKQMESIILPLTGLDWNLMHMDGHNSIEKFSELLMHKGTHKSIWIIDQLLVHHNLSLQQIEWQWHLIKCLEYAGFEIIHFDSHLFMQYKNYWPRNTNSLFRSTSKLFHEIKIHERA